ncbi:MAG: hypothetical protein K2X77_26025 [Candidatus Obscuribacterales bacterium]|nr:hypothetical protein [Candidatus Obscuribacterales bacterium]
MSDLIEILKRFNEDATKCILISQEETRRSGHSVVGPAQLLLGLSLVERSQSRNILEARGVRGSAIRRKILDLIGLGEGHVPVEIPFNDEAKNLIKNAASIAQEKGSETIGTEHLLSALIDVSDKQTDQIVQELSISRADLDQDLQKVFELNP